MKRLASVSIKRGLFRMWVVLSGFWLIFVVGMAVDALDDLANRDFQWVEVRATFQGISESPFHIEKPLTFLALESRHKTEWRRRVGEGAMKYYGMPDGSGLFLSSNWTKEELDFVRHQFWEQRWSRRFDVIWRLLLLAFSLPLAALVLGIPFIWAFSGFKR